MSAWLDDWGGVLVAVTSVALAAVVSAHAVLTRRDGRNAIGWVGLVWLVPVLGSILYVSLGINRIRRRATAMRKKRGSLTDAPLPAAALGVEDPTEAWGQAPAALPGTALQALVTLGDNLTDTTLLAGNEVVPLLNGDRAYPEMLEAIERARDTVTLTSYIFDHDVVGLRFVAALTAAHQRGVAVRVLVDAVGARYSWPKRSVVDLLADAGVPARRFNPNRSPIRLRYLNLRSHRKILVVDGRIGFTGGLNIRVDCDLSAQPEHPTRDLHFRLRGPVVSQLQLAFAEDWWFTTGQRLGEAWWQPQQAVGQARARAIVDGPDEDMDKLRRIILGALSVAERRVCIATPYFLPDPDIVAALDVAALRGVSVEVLLPATSNLQLVGWAMTHQLRTVLERGCRVWLSPEPFDHTKLMVVDDQWTLLGSGNWDPRSLRLNFEFNVEVHDAALAGAVARIFDDKRAQSEQLELQQLAALPLWVQVRNGVAALLTPYL